MSRSTARSTRIAASMIGAAGIVVLAGCTAGGDTSSTATTDAPVTSSSTSSTTPSSAATEATSTDGTTGSSSGYADGTYTAEGSYQTPRGSVETISVTLTLGDGDVTAVEVSGNPTERESKQFQGQFISGISSEVVGQSIADLKVGIVAGSSLTGIGFNAAVNDIRTQAQD